MEPLYSYVYMKGDEFIQMKNTRKAYFLPIAERGELVGFYTYRAARDAMIKIAETSASNVPTGMYNLIAVRTMVNEPAIVLPYYIGKEITNEQLATEQRTDTPHREAVQRFDPPLRAELDLFWENRIHVK